MTKTLGEAADDYHAPQKLVVSDLAEVPLTATPEVISKTDQEGKPYEYLALMLNGNEYRIPGPVLEQIKEIRKLKPSVTKVKVTKSGTGAGTRYKTEALD